ncbi:MAG: nicotinate-nucleotide adenylyltransferase [Boseongicola sp. SB0677_bin_26]|nr:nicotinate-nucleotide adenylyltransferase [Boseongicola sp. SB0665_bin_10]MYG24799.1 nicotinate-nucleotide adenylyltransferase [Boseongicola sp. SB0677_bin_26]
MESGFPLARTGMRIGLLGGSFDPAHEGHAHITREALKRLALDEVWWLVSPGNPLKDNGPAPLPERMARAREVMRHPRVRVTDLEVRLGTRRTCDSLVRMTCLFPGVRFAWLMGADNLADLHRWDRWEEIMALVPVAVLARPGHRVSPLFSPAARRFRRGRLPARAAPQLALADPPAWTFLNVPMSDLSSTRIRGIGGWPRG